MSGLIISSRILWMNVSRLFAATCFYVFGGFLAGVIGSVFWFVVSFYDGDVKKMFLVFG